MRTLNDIISESAEVLRPLLQEAFEAGKTVGRHEAAIDLRTKIDGVLSADAAGKLVHVSPKIPANGVNPKRAVSGSVKPVIANLIKGAASGLTIDDIAKATGFKVNSIRGTLWTLGKERAAVKRKGRWFPLGSPKGEAEAVGASANH